MRHGVDGRHLSRNTSHRLAMLRNLANSIIQKEQVITTVPKAKEVRRVVEKLITLGKSGTPHHHRIAFDRTRSKLVVGRLFSTLAERYKNRAGGYTRILKLSDTRRGDAAEMAVIELVDHPPLNRKRTKVAANSAAEASNEAAAAAKPKASDPFKGFKKMFGKGKKDPGAAGKGGRAERAPKAQKSTHRKIGGSE